MDKPMVQYAVEETLTCGMEQIIIDEIFDSPVLEPMISLDKELGYSIIAVLRLMERDKDKGDIAPKDR